MCGQPVELSCGWRGESRNSSPAFPASQRVFPYISAMVNNGSLTYDHDRDGRPTELGGCTAMVRNLNHDTFLVIRYVKRRLTVSAAGQGGAGCGATEGLRELFHSSGVDRHRR